MKFALTIIIGLLITVSFYSFQTTSNEPSLIRWGDAQPGKISKEKAISLLDSMIVLNRPNSSVSFFNNKLDVYFIYINKDTKVYTNYYNRIGGLNIIRQRVETMTKGDKISFDVLFKDNKFKKVFGKSYEYIIN
jgi:hypothetical protein